MIKVFHHKRYEVLVKKVSDILKGKRFKISTLGCKVNQYESDAINEILRDAGCIPANDDEPADICIVNTCSVTNIADRKSRQILHRMKKQNPDAIICATGCYVQAVGDKILEDSSIDLIIGNNRKKDSARIISEYLTNGKISDNYIDVNKDPEFENLSIVTPETHTRAYVKIQDGCNEFCTYCIIPYVRGRIKSKPLLDITAEVDTLAANGTKEIILTGINVSAYKDDYTDANNGTTQHIGLAEVIKRISKIEGIERIRLSSMDPRIITKQFLDTVSRLPEFCPHFHLSLQSACNNTLKRMNRKYTIEEYKAACELIRSYFDRPAITTDIIVGFPGETDDDFEDTYNNLTELNLYEMHVFKYSKRQGTVAEKLPDQVDERIKNTRSDRLLELTAKQKASFEKSFEGETERILIEEIIEKENVKYFRGHTMRYILVDIPVDSIIKDEEAGSYINRVIEIKL